MARVKDPVCGMTIDSDTAAGQATHQGQTYYFCSEQCRARFEREPSKYVEGAQR